MARQTMQPETLMDFFKRIGVEPDAQTMSAVASMREEVKKPPKPVRTRADKIKRIAAKREARAREGKPIDGLMDDTNAKYIPSQEEIEAECERIQSTWSELIKENRDQRAKPKPVEVPLVSLIGSERRLHGVSHGD